jgi:methyl-accepting chemotaxis protein
MRVLGWLAMILGVLGIVAGLALIPGAYLGRDWIGTRVDRVVERAQDGLDQATEFADRVDTAVTNATVRIEEIETTAAEARDAVDFTGPVERLSTAMTSFVTGPYSQLQTTYADLRGRVFAVTDAVAAVDAALPAISLPGVVTDELEEIDTRILDLNDRVLEIQASLEDGVTSAEEFTPIQTTASNISDGLTQIDELADGARARIETAQGRLDEFNRRIDGWLSIGMIGVAIIGLYLAGLHVLLFQQGRRWARGEQAPG